MNDRTTSSQLTLPEALVRADEWNRAGRHEECIRLLSGYFETNPEPHWLNFHLGRAYAGLKRHAEAYESFGRAAASAYPYRVGALYEIARLDISLGRFDRAHLLDEALALPGDVNARDEAANQKRFYFDRIYLLKALSALRGGDLAAAHRHIGTAYDFNRAIDERPFAFPWLIESLAEVRPSDDEGNVEYLRQRLLYSGMTRGLSYTRALDALPRGAKAVEIGGMDGVRFDALHSYLKRGQFDAVVVEPTADMFALLTKNYAGCGNVRCANVAITESSGPLELYRVSTEEIAKHGLAEWIHGVTSAFKGPVLTYLEKHVSTETVRGLAFEDFAAEFGVDRFHVLQIDTEGSDWNILKQIDLNRRGVNVAQVEVVNLTPCDRLKVFSHLREAGYLFNCEFGEVVAVSRAFHSAHLSGS